MNRIDKVKRMTTDEAIEELRRGTQQSRSTNNQRLREALGLGIEALSKECQLFPQPLDEEEWEWALGELLTEKEINKVLGYCPRPAPQASSMEIGSAIFVAKAQHDKDSALLQPKIEEATKQIVSIIKEYRLESASARDDELVLRAKGWKLLWQALSGKGGESMVCGYLKSVKSARSLRLNTRLLLVASRHMIIM